MSSNSDLEAAVELSTTLEEDLEEFYSAIEDGDSLSVALSEYESDIDEAIDEVAYLIVDEIIADDI